MNQHIGREHPAEGVYILDDQSTIASLTVCSRKRCLLLATFETRDALLAAWREANAWRVGLYLIMPDHIHLFCSPMDDKCTIERWITFWKRCVRRALKSKEAIFQSHSFHHRLRRDENYTEKWEYVRMNPVRAGLVQKSEDWPYQGVVHDLEW